MVKLISFAKDKGFAKINSAVGATGEQALTDADDCSAKNSFLFVTTKEGGVVNTRSINQNFIAIAKQVGISQFGVHTLRHTFGTNLSDAEVPSREIADLMGHRYTTVTQKYIHKNVEHLRKAITKI